MAVMSSQPHELRLILQGHHLPGLREIDQRILAARCWGCPAAELAPLLGYTSDALRRLFDRLQDVILAPTGMKRDLALVTQWFVMHEACERQCLPYAAGLIACRTLYAG